MVVTKIIVFLGVVSAVNGQLIDWQQYANNVGQRTIELLEGRDITGSALPMDDCRNYINKSLYGARVAGYMDFESGFVVRIEGASLKDTSLKSANSDLDSTVSAQLALAGIDIFYDVQYFLEGYTERGSLRLWIPETLFDLMIKKNHVTGLVSGSLTYLSTGNQNLMKVTVFPSNAFTQLTAREMKLVLAFRQNITQSMRNWNTNLQAALDVALEEIQFPELCYYC